MPRKQRKSTKQQRGGGYRYPNEYFGHNSGAYFDASDPCMTHRASDASMARAEHAIRGDVTGIQTGGGGTHMPSEYFGHSSGAYLDANDPALSLATLDNTVARAEHAVLGDVTGIQTGGSHYKKRKSRIRRTSRKTNRKTRSCKRKEKRHGYSVRRRKSFRQRGGAHMPVSYYGGKDHGFSDQSGSVSYRTAYGDSVGTSFGTSDTVLGQDFVGPNHAPGGAFVDGVSSGVQTGGGK